MRESRLAPIRSGPEKGMMMMMPAARDSATHLHLHLYLYLYLYLYLVERNTRDTF